MWLSGAVVSSKRTSGPVIPYSEQWMATNTLTTISSQLQKYDFKEMLVVSLIRVVSAVTVSKHLATLTYKVGSQVKSVMI